jgi:hypothetical protein
VENKTFPSLKTIATTTHFSFQNYFFAYFVKISIFCCDLTGCNKKSYALDDKYLRFMSSAYMWQDLNFARLSPGGGVQWSKSPPLGQKTAGSNPR